jgi:2-methylcitrate dehydratase PrpD
MKADEETRHETGRALTALMAWAASVRYEDIPAAVLSKAALVIADDLAAMIAARDEPEVKRAHDQLLGYGSGRDVTVFRGGRPRTDRYSAVLANGIAGSWCELDEGFRHASCHAGLYTLPALLAEAELRNLTVGDVLRAAVVAYEITARFARCWRFPQLTLHPHPQTAAIGGAAATGVARGYTAPLLMDAITAASTLVTAGHFEHAIDGALVRNVWAAVGTSNGMRAADWAQCGIGGKVDGPLSVYTDLLGQPPNPRFLNERLGEDWSISSGFHKVHACCQSTHSAVEAMLMAVAEMGSRRGADDIERVVLETHRPGMSNRRPATTLAAKFSYEHALATAQVHGHAGSEAFAAETLTEPRVARLRERIELRAYEPLPQPPHDRPARLTLHFNDGSTLVTQCLSAMGGPDRPFADDVIVDKIGTITRDVYPRLLPVMASIMALDAPRLASGWETVVAEMCGD